MFYIKEYLGNSIEAAKTAKELSTETGLDVREIRRMIQYDRRWNNAPIIGCSSGYYITDNPEIILQNANKLSREAKQLLEISESLRRTATDIKFLQLSEKAKKENNISALIALARQLASGEDVEWPDE